MEKPHTYTSKDSTSYDTSHDVQRYITTRRIRIFCTTLVGVQLFIALAIAITLGISVSNISHDPYLPMDVQIDLKSMSDTHYMSLVGCILTVMNAITALIGIRKSCRKILNVYVVFAIITTLLTLASGSLYIVWHSKLHAILMAAPCFIGILCVTWIYILRKRLKEISNLISV